MSEVKGHYLQALAEFAAAGEELIRSPKESLTERFAYSSASDIIELHKECLQELAKNASPEETVLLYKRSLDFLNEFMLMCRNSVYSAPASLLLIKNKYENVLQHLDSGIALFNEQGCLTFMNMRMARIIGVPRKALIGSHFLSILRNKSIPKKARKSMCHLYREMVDYRMPYHEMVTSQGRHLLITVTYEDELSGDLLLSVKDVTEFKRIEQAAYQNDKLAILGKISAAIAHEIRNPLTSIRGFIQFLKPDLTNLGKQEYADIILAEIDRANQIIYEFLNSSKPTAPVKKRTSAAGLLREVLMLFESNALLNQCKIESETMDPGLYFDVDEKQVKQVLLNIVKNAMEAVSGRPDHEGLIRLKVEREGSWIRLEVQDNGNGMDQDTISRLFDPFFTTKEDGTGLGLSVSYRIVRNHGGKIDVKSKIGEGTAFILRFPESPALIAVP